MKIRPATKDAPYEVARVIRSLGDALGYAQAADCPRLVLKIRSALKSADGARRHVHHRLSRTNSDGSTRHYADRAKT